MGDTYFLAALIFEYIAFLNVLFMFDQLLYLEQH